jgi:hypothetical protein
MGTDRDRGRVQAALVLAATKDAPPVRHSGAETFVFGLRDVQVGGREPLERQQSLEEGGRIETRVLLGRQLQQRLKLEAPGQLGQVEELASFGPVEECEDLVGGEFPHRNVGP